MQDVHFSGKTSKILWDELAKYNISRKDCYVTNIVTEMLSQGQKPTAEMVAKHRPKLEKDLKENNPLLIVTVGKFATEEMLMIKISNFVDLAGRALFCDWSGRWLVPCIHPAAVARNPELQKPFADCVWMVAEALKEIKATK